jgi:hypothetical protein
LQTLSDRANINRKIALCTDSFEVQNYAKKLFGDRVICVSQIPDTKGKTLHGNLDIDRYRANLDALTDLFVLACAKKLYSTVIDRCDDRVLEKRIQSSFGSLALALNKRPRLTKRLLSGEN